MYERFTDRARRVMQMANQESQQLNHGYIGTEHILLGLIEEGGGVAANVLRRFVGNLLRIRSEVEKLAPRGLDAIWAARLPQTPRAKKVIEHSIEEAKNLAHNYVGTEHLLLGLLREGEGIAAQVLTRLGLKLEEVREVVLEFLGRKEEDEQPRLVEPGAVTKTSLLQVLRAGGYEEADLTLVVGVLCTSPFWRRRFLDMIVRPIIEVRKGSR